MVEFNPDFPFENYFSFMLELPENLLALSANFQFEVMRLSIKIMHRRQTPLIHPQQPVSHDFKPVI